MPYRRIPFATGEIYHLFNRSIGRQPIFTNSKDYQRFSDTVNFYRFQKPQSRFSHYNRLPKESKTHFLENLYKTRKKLVEIYTFAFMPNHFHFLVRQNEENGISLFMSQIQNSYAKYFDTKYKWSGGVFQSMFKAVRVESEEQFTHVARYIHLNPLTSFILKKIKDLEKYPWNSYAEYVENISTPFLEKELLLNYFPSKQKLRKFMEDQVEYQRLLKRIEHLIME